MSDAVPDTDPRPSIDPGLVVAVDLAHAAVASAERTLLSLIAQVDRCGSWERLGARDSSHWLAMRYGLSEWKARRWIVAAHALEDLPGLCRALSDGSLGIDKVVELARFATPQTEARLIGWARGVSGAAIRRRGDRALTPSPTEVVEVQQARHLSWWTVDEGRRLALEAELPAAEGAVVVKAIARLANRLPVMPGEHDDPPSVAARRADALVALSSATIAADPDPDRATVVVHTTLDGLRTGGNAETDGDGVIPAPTLDRLLCTARVQAVVEDDAGNAIGIGRLSRVPPAWLVRQVRHRDRECRFPGCGARAFTEAHHVVWWRNGGRTDLDNLLLICSFHHRLAHEYGWSVRRSDDGSVEWRDPGGVRYRAGPMPDRRPETPPLDPSERGRRRGRSSAA